MSFKLAIPLQGKMWVRLLYMILLISENRVRIRIINTLCNFGFKTVNADGFGDYQSGLTSTIQQLEDYGNLGVIGDATEPLLATAINQIIASGKMIPQPEKTFIHCSDSKAIEPLRSEMYIELK
jgi:hypothetical protein